MKTLRYPKKRERRVPNLKGAHPSVESVMSSAVSYHKLLATWTWDKNTPHCSRLATCHTRIPVSFKSRNSVFSFQVRIPVVHHIDALQITPFQQAAHWTDSSLWFVSNQRGGFVMSVFIFSCGGVMTPWWNLLLLWSIAPAVIPSWRIWYSKFFTRLEAWRWSISPRTYYLFLLKF